ncbi:MAG: hypothetical protein ISR80_05925 [Nitrosopumilus sp.]|nr:hypothetical protein [Nitrosopumilus sp.]
MISVPCEIADCEMYFDSALELMIHKHENHDSLTDSQQRLLKRWIDVK